MAANKRKTAFICSLAVWLTRYIDSSTREESAMEQAKANQSALFSHWTATGCPQNLAMEEKDHVSKERCAHLRFGLILGPRDERNE